jgi:hypothetical protein
MFWRCARLGFFGRRLVGLMLDGSHHGEGEHDERDVTMPAVPGSGFVVVEPELVFGCLEAILDRPAMALDADQGLDRMRYFMCCAQGRLARSARSLWALHNGVQSLQSLVSTRHLEVDFRYASGEIARQYVSDRQRDREGPSCGQRG